MLSTVLRSRDPGHRLDINGMHGKQCRHHKAPPGIARRAPQHPEEQHRVQRMQQHAGLVMSGGILVVHLEIQRVRQPGDRVPVAGVVGDERPGHGVPGQAVLDVDVLGDVDVVVVIDEGMALDRVVKADAEDDEDAARRRKDARPRAPMERSDANALAHQVASRPNSPFPLRSTSIPDYFSSIAGVGRYCSSA